MRQAIETRFLGPTNHRGARIVAKCQAGRIVIPYSYEHSCEECHRGAAMALASKLGWSGSLIGGGSADGKGYVFVFSEGS